MLFSSDYLCFEDTCLYHLWYYIEYIFEKINGKYKLKLDKDVIFNLDGIFDLSKL